MRLEQIIREALPYKPGQLVNFYSPDADENFEGTIESVDIELTEDAFDLYFHIYVEQTEYVGKYYGKHVIRDHDILNIV